MKPPRVILDVREHVAAFAAYRAKESCWGIFHVALDDGNYECGAWAPLGRDIQAALQSKRREASAVARGSKGATDVDDPTAAKAKREGEYEVLTLDDAHDIYRAHYPDAELGDMYPWLVRWAWAPMAERAGLRRRAADPSP